MKKKVFGKSSKGGNVAAKLFFKKNLPYILLAAALIAVALAVTLTLVLTRDRPAEDVITPPTPSVYTLPVASYSEYSGTILTSFVYSDTLNKWTTKNGVDFYTEKGEQVMAVRDGKVISVKDTVLDAKVITIQHDDGMVSVYRNISTDSAIEVDDLVTKGQVIGTVTDEIMRVLDGAPRLTLEIKVNNKFVDPLTYFPELSDK